MVVSEITYSTLANKCPRCHRGKVFAGNNPYSFKRGLTMNCSCSECGLKYERETGFFYGAMYVSYALMSGLLIVWFLVDLLWLQMNALNLALSVTLTMCLLFPVSYRWARSIWLNFFVRYDKRLQLQKVNHDLLNSTALKPNKKADA